jgi:hypothetical protein
VTPIAGTASLGGEAADLDAARAVIERQAARASI